MKYLIAGLGNIGAEYANTRHNIGFMVLDDLAAQSEKEFAEERYGSVCKLKYAGRQLILLKPNTYMNLSGKAVKYWMDKEKISPSKLLVITDDIALPTAKLRLKPSGSDGGHNGLKNINEILGHKNFPRLRFGVGNDYGKGQQVDYVLSAFPAADLEAVQKSIETCREIVKSLVRRGIAQTMNTFN
jgi:PTH1 family peptidyl-tRNA hydrolase